MNGFVYLIVIVEGMVEVLLRFPRDNVYFAEKAFVDAMEERIPNFEDYTASDIEACLENGYQGDGRENSIQLHWSD